MRPTIAAVLSPIDTSGGCSRTETDFTAIGMGGQFVHVYPDKDTLIVQLSDWDDGGDELECETFRAHDALMRAMQ